METKNLKRLLNHRIEELGKKQKELSPIDTEIIRIGARRKELERLLGLIEKENNKSRTISG